MNERLHELRAEIKTIDEMLDSLSGPMHELAHEEQINLQFELEMLQRNLEKHASPQPAFEHHQEETSGIA
jgi:hypothetical protein